MRKKNTQCIILEGMYKTKCLNSNCIKFQKQYQETKNFSALHKTYSYDTKKIRVKKTTNTKKSRDNVQNNRDNVQENFVHCT